MLLVVRYVVYQALAVTLPSSLSLLAQEYNSLAASDASVGESFYGASRSSCVMLGRSLRAQAFAARLTQRRGTA